MRLLVKSQEQRQEQRLSSNKGFLGYIIVRVQKVITYATGLGVYLELVSLAKPSCRIDQSWRVRFHRASFAHSHSRVEPERPFGTAMFTLEEQ